MLQDNDIRVTAVSRPAIPESRHNGTLGDTVIPAGFGSQGVEQKWRGASEHCSPNYTINFADLPVVKAK